MAEDLSEASLERVIALARAMQDAGVRLFIRPEVDEHGLTEEQYRFRGDAFNKDDFSV